MRSSSSKRSRAKPRGSSPQDSLPPPTEKIFRPGELAPVSGVYVARHLNDHRKAHEVLLIRGEELPACRVCQMEARFEIAHMASHVTHDWDFAGPTRLAVTKGSAYFSVRPRAPRYKVRLPLKIALSGRDGGLLVSGEAVDLSAGGVGTSLSRALPASGAPVVIHLSGGGERVRIAAQMRHRQDYRHGFQFTALSDQARHWLREEIKRAASRPGV